MRHDDFRAALKELGIKQTQFAAMVGNSRASVGKWVNGKRSIPRWVDLVIKLLRERRDVAKQLSGDD